MDQFSFDHRQQIAAVNRRANFRIDSQDSSALGRFQLILHLHRFNHSDTGSSFDTLTYFDEHAYNLSRHWRYDARSSVTMRTERRRATQTLWIDDRNGVSIRPDNHIKGEAGLGPPFNDTIKNLCVRNQQIVIVAKNTNIYVLFPAVDHSQDLRTLLVKFDFDLRFSDSRVQLHELETARAIAREIVH